METYCRAHLVASSDRFLKGNKFFMRYSDSIFFELQSQAIKYQSTTQCSRFKINFLSQRHLFLDYLEQIGSQGLHDI